MSINDENRYPSYDGRTFHESQTQWTSYKGRLCSYLWSLLRLSSPMTRTPTTPSSTDGSTGLRRVPGSPVRRGRRSDMIPLPGLRLWDTLQSRGQDDLQRLYRLTFISDEPLKVTCLERRFPRYILREQEGGRPSRPILPNPVSEGTLRKTYRKTYRCSLREPLRGASSGEGPMEDVHRVWCTVRPPSICLCPYRW